MRNNNRYLQRRGKTWYYNRAVPLPIKSLDPRWPRVKMSLGVKDVHEAREKRDAQESRDDLIWGELGRGVNAETAWEKYETAQDSSRAAGFRHINNLRELSAAEYKEEVKTRLRYLVTLTTPQVARSEEEAKRLGVNPNEPNVLPEAMAEGETTGRMMNALFGMEKRPVETMTSMLELYLGEVNKMAYRNMSPNQVRQAHKWPKKAVQTFIDVVGDKPVMDVTRDDARRIYRYWQHRMSAGGRGSSGVAANKEIGTLQRMLDRYFIFIGEFDKPNPFAKLKLPEDSEKRMPWSQQQIAAVLQTDIICKLNTDQKRILIVCVETGARLSEIANLTPDAIRLDDDVPHIVIEPVTAGKTKRAVKNKQSIRTIPLVGAALYALQKQPNGFPKYQDKGDTISANVGSFLKRRNFLLKGQTGVHSLRHSIKDRLREAKVDEALIKAIHGHAEDGIVYGTGFSLERKLEALEAVALPFDPAVV